MNAVLRKLDFYFVHCKKNRISTCFFSLTPAIQSVQTAIDAHPNHDAIATAKIFCGLLRTDLPKYGILARLRSTWTASSKPSSHKMLPHLKAEAA